MARLDLSANTLGEGRATVTTPGTAVPLSTSSVPCAWVVVTAETDNSNRVTVGGAGVVGALATRKGTPLAAGESASLPVDNLNNIYIDAITATEGVTFTYGVGI